MRHVTKINMNIWPGCLCLKGNSLIGIMTIIHDGNAGQKCAYRGIYLCAGVVWWSGTNSSYACIIMSHYNYVLRSMHYM